MECSIDEEDIVTSQKGEKVEMEALNIDITNNGKGEDYENWTREDLIEKIRKLTCHVKQLRNVIKRDGQITINENETDVRSVKKAKRTRSFDFSKHPKRHVALKIAYLGWDYQGLAVQEDTNGTIEAHLFNALTQAKLIENRNSSNYHRCGRTDKGVSAFSQVISIDLRCKCNEGQGIMISHCDEETINNINSEKISSLDREIDYCKILNALLPKEIRVIAWTPVKPDFSARFDCKERVYKYFVPIGNANADAIQQAGQYLLGTHDFQNFCKPDNSLEHTIRRIISVSIIKCDSELENSVKNEQNSTQQVDPYAIFQIEIRGQSFLWHQIRCIIALLVLVGQGYEKPEIVRDLLDFEKFPQKPQYAMAVDFPLVLFDTYHAGDITEWIYNPENIIHVLGDLQAIWAQHAIRASMVFEMIKNLEKSMRDVIINDAGEQISLSGKRAGTDVKWIPSSPKLPFIFPSQQLHSIIMGTRIKIYKNLVDRPVCGSTGASRSNSTNNKSTADLNSAASSNDAKAEI